MLARMSIDIVNNLTLQMSLSLSRLFVPAYIVFRAFHSRGSAQVFTLAIATFLTLSCFNPIFEFSVLIGQFIE